MTRTFHLFTVGSNTSKLENLYLTCELAGAELKYIHVDHWTGFVDKILAFKRVVDTLPEGDIACFIDAYDVLAFANETEIVGKFREYGHNILLSTELNCYPTYLKPQYDALKKKDHSNFNYVNSGGYMGYVKDLREMFAWKTEEEMRAICEDGGDQHFFALYYLTHMDNVGLDTRQEIFQSLYKVRWIELQFESGRLYNTVLKTYPCFVHFNGYNAFRNSVIHDDTGVYVNATETFMKKMYESYGQPRGSTPIPLPYHMPYIICDGLLHGCLDQMTTTP
jgi:hypothetical protein